MQFLYRIPGYILLLFGGFCLSWGGFIIRSFDEATVWQILLLRSVFFMIALTFFLIATYKKNTIKIFYMHYKALNIQKFKNTRILAFAGIGNPENFFQLIQKNNLYNFQDPDKC